MQSAMTVIRWLHRELTRYESALAINDSADSCLQQYFFFKSGINKQSAVESATSDRDWDTV